jgi:hypothetical protein
MRLVLAGRVLRPLVARVPAHSLIGGYDPRLEAP